MRRLAIAMVGVAVVAGLAGCAATEEGPPDLLDQQLLVDEDTFQQVFREAETPPSIQISLETDAEQSLLVEPREWVPAVVRVGERAWDAELRLKGNGSFQPLDAKPSFKIRFDPPFFGLDTLVLNNSVSDPTHAHEILARDAFEMLHLPTATAGHAWVQLESGPVEEWKGLYVAAEDVDRALLHRWFANPDGTLYELFDGDFEEGLLDGFELEEGPGDPGLLSQIAADLAVGDVLGFELAAEHLDRRRFFRFWAATVLLGQTDAWPYSLPGDDVYVYIDPRTDTLTFLPHGLDEAFIPRGRTLAETNGSIARRCLANPDCLDELVQTLIGISGELERAGWLDRVAVVLDDVEAYEADPRFRPSEVQEPAVHRDQLRNWLEVRQAQLEAELEGAI